MQPLRQARKTVEGDGTLQVIVGDAQVFAAAEQLAGEIAHLAPLRWRGGQYGIAHLPFRLALSGTLEFEEYSIVFEVVATGCVCRDRFQQSLHIHHKE
ncbi:hypothetical protein D9M68_876140 [compost metagenome]